MANLIEQAKQNADALLQEAEQEVTGLLKTSDGDETDGI